MRDYVTALLQPRDRNKTLTALAEAEPGVGATHREVQRLQWFVSESPWEHEPINDRRIDLLMNTPATAPHQAGALLLDDSGDRKSGHATAYVSRQYIGSRAQITGGIVAVTTTWADERIYYPLHTVPYQPAPTLPQGRADAAFRTKGRIAAELVERARAAGIPSRAHPGRWRPVRRRYRDGHTATWWAIELTLGRYGPDRPHRLIVASSDPTTLPVTGTFYLTTNLPRRPRRSALPVAGLAEIVRLYGLRGWIEQDYKQIKHELGWADFQVRSGRAIQRHWALVNLAFCFCWLHPADDPGRHPTPAAGATPPDDQVPAPPAASPARQETWPERLRRIRAYLTPIRDLSRLARNGVLSLCVPELAGLIATLAKGVGVNLYLPP
ncbi:hypothetical protein GCM10023075_33970 [Streptosporangium album]